MALQVWLPLNGNLNNYGLDTSANFTCSSASYVNGKIGKALDINSYLTNTPCFSSLTKVKEYSITCWIYLDSSKSFVSFSDFFNIYADTDSRTGVIRIEHMSVDKKGYFQIVMPKNTSYGSDTNPYYVTAYDCTQAKNKWLHVVITQDSKKIKIYFNGAMIYSTALSSFCTNNSLTGQVSIGASGASYGASVKICDFRIYDECISKKQIQELAKGLCCHLKLSNPYETGQKNKYSGDYAEGMTVNYSGFTRTKLTQERGYNYKLSRTGDGRGGWFTLNFPTFSFTVGKTYYYSCKVRCHSKSNVYLTLRASRSYNDWVTRSVNVLIPDGKWHEYYTYQTINETYDRSGATVTSNPVLEFYTNDLSTSGTVYSADFDIKDIQVIESDCYVPFIENSMSSTTVSDCSGYGNDGTVSGGIVYKNNSPRYKGSYYFGANSNTKAPSPVLSFPQLSCSFWVKLQSDCGSYATVISDYNNLPNSFKNASLWLAVNTEKSGLWFYNGVYARSNKGILSLNTWYHVCFVFNNGVVTWYQNGEFAGSTDVSSGGTTVNINSGYLSIGNSYTGTSWDTDFVGQLSDVRIYATALSENSIKELFQSPISLSSDGCLLASEFEEV